MGIFYVLLILPAQRRQKKTQQMISALKNGDKVVTLYDERGRPQTRLVAELILEAFAGPRPPGHVVCFKDGNRLNCELTNLEWVASGPTREESARARAIATRERADAMRRSLEGRPHSDSALLVAEDRLR